MLESTDINIQTHPIEAVMLVDELSSTEFYIGTSKNDKDPARPYWRIKRIYKIGSVWKFEFPNGDQDFKYVWDDRLSYTYSA